MRFTEKELQSVPKLFKIGYDAGYRAAWDENPKALPLSTSGYGSCQSVVLVVYADTIVQLAHKIRNMRSERRGAGPGQCFAYTCKPIMIHRGDGTQLEAICVASSLWDV